MSARPDVPVMLPFVSLPCGVVAAGEQCFSGWDRRSFCNSPRVFQTTGQFLQATQGIDFLCNLCEVDFVNSTAQSVRFFRVPQPLQKATGLLLTTTQDLGPYLNDSAANPIILVAQVWPTTTSRGRASTQLVSCTRAFASPCVFFFCL
jgi:hypothetical protein